MPSRHNRHEKNIISYTLHSSHYIHDTVTVTHARNALTSGIEFILSDKCLLISVFIKSQTVATLYIK